MRNPNPVVWFEIYVEDMSRARAFYEKVFDISLSELPMPPMESGPTSMFAFPGDMTTFGSGGSLVQMPGFSPGGSGTIVYFGSEDCAIEEARLKEVGADIIRSKTSLGEFGFMVLAHDSEGNVIGIHSMK